MGRSVHCNYHGLHPRLSDISSTRELLVSHDVKRHSSSCFSDAPAFHACQLLISLTGPAHRGIALVVHVWVGPLDQ